MGTKLGCVQAHGEQAVYSACQQTRPRYLAGVRAVHKLLQFSQKVAQKLLQNSKSCSKVAPKSKSCSKVAFIFLV